LKETRPLWPPQRGVGLREPNLGKTNPRVSLTYSLAICFVPSLADSILFLTLTRLVVVCIFVNFSFALFTPPLGDYHHAQGCLESRHRFHSREGAVLAQVAVQFPARRNRRAGYMTCGPGPPCWTRRSRKGMPPWCGCMPPAWRSALSPTGLGESGGVLVTAGQLRALRAAV
jgi:hypothetical protein